MNADDFERQLQRQPMRAVPPEWREQILPAAPRQPDYVPHLKPYELRRSWLREILWPSPTAWAGLAAAWVVIFALQFDSGQRAKMAAVKSAPPSRQVLDLLRAQQSLLAELFHSSVPVEPPRHFLPQPRAQRRSNVTAA